MTPAGFPHSDTPGSTLGCQLPRAYRRLLRPSSALDAKASTMCPSQLVTHTTNPPHPTTSHPTTHKKAPPPPRENPGKKQSPLIKCQTTGHQRWSGQAVHTTHYKDARVHYPDLKQQPHTSQTRPASTDHTSQPGACWYRSPRHTPTTHRHACTQTRPHSGHGNGDPAQS